MHKNTGVVEQYSYNTLNQLVEYRKLTATTPQTHYTYLYDAMGRRIGKADKLNSTVTAFQWLGSQMVSEQTQGKTKTNYVLDGGLTPVAAMQDNAQYDYYKDHLGTVHNVTNSNGSNVWSGDYSTFGQVQETSNGHLHNLRFAGQYHDRESGLYYNFYRDYDPTLGRYVQTDPIGLVAGLNTYGYVNGNPLTYVDPLGLDWVYSQSTGQMTQVINGQTQAGQGGAGYAGRGAGLNNPAAQNQSNVGPIPQGTYTIGQQTDSANTGPAILPLTPDPNNNMHGRSAFQIHGDNSAMNNTASHGCIILSRPIRDQIGNSGDNTLIVAP